MSYGISIKNNAGNILISSELEGLHCAGQASFVLTLLSGLTDFPDYASDDGANTLSGRCIYRYQYYGSQSRTPVFFIRPIAATEQYYGVVNQWYYNGAWYCDVVCSGGSTTAPYVYVFVPPRDVSPVGADGIMTHLSDGNVAFDSRRKPLAIDFAVSAIPPVSPCDGGIPLHQEGYAWNDNVLDFDFTSDDTYNEYNGGGAIPSAPMFSAPSLAQAVYSRIKYGYKSSCGTYSCQDHWSTAVWWVMYQQGYKLTAAGNLRAGWIPLSAGYYFSSVYDSGGWFDGGGGSYTTGNAPYPDKTINRVYNTVIVASSTYY